MRIPVHIEDTGIDPEKVCQPMAGHTDEVLPTREPRAPQRCRVVSSPRLVGLGTPELDAAPQRTAFLAFGGAACPARPRRMEWDPHRGGISVLLGSPVRPHFRSASGGCQFRA